MNVYDVTILNLLYYTIIILHLFSSPLLFLYLESLDVHQSLMLDMVVTNSTSTVVDCYI